MSETKCDTFFRCKVRFPEALTKGDAVDMPHAEGCITTHLTYGEFQLLQRLGTVTVEIEEIVLVTTIKLTPQEGKVGTEARG